MHGRSMDYVGATEEREHWHTEYTECPKCGGRMRVTSEMCAQCWKVERPELDFRSKLPEMLDRHRRYCKALSTGLWTEAELQALAQQGHIPTKRDIVLRVWERVRATPSTE